MKTKKKRKKRSDLYRQRPQQGSGGVKRAAGEAAAMASKAEQRREGGRRDGMAVEVARQAGRAARLYGRRAGEEEGWCSDRGDDFRRRLRRREGERNLREMEAPHVALWF